MAQPDAAEADAELIELLPDGGCVSDEDREEAMRIARDLWNRREVTDVETTEAGDGNTVVVHKDGFRASFGLRPSHRSVELAEIGIATFEVHDRRGDFVLEDVEVAARPDAGKQTQSEYAVDVIEDVRDGLLDVKMGRLPPSVRERYARGSEAILDALGEAEALVDQ